MERPCSFNPGDGCGSQEKRLLVMHVSCPPIEFNDRDVARKFVASLDADGMTSPDIYEFDPAAGGWRRLESTC